MIIYEVTNKYKTQELCFSKYYPTKELAIDNKASNLEVYKIELYPLGRDEIASILSMNHVRMEQVNGGWNEVHDISHLIKSEELIK